MDTATLVELATKASCFIRARKRLGDFVMEKEPLADVHGEKGETGGFEKLAAGAFYIGNNRTATQDLEFVLLELVEIAVRALAPGINDPFTANTCVDRLTEALCRVADKADPKVCRYDEKGKLHIVLDETRFDGLADTAFNQIRQYGAKDASVLIHLLESLEKLFRHTRRISHRKIIWRHSCKVYRTGQRLEEPQDRRDVQERFQRLARLYSDCNSTKSD